MFLTARSESIWGEIVSNTQSLLREKLQHSIVNIMEENSDSFSLERFFTTDEAQYVHNMQRERRDKRHKKFSQFSKAH